MRPENQNSPLLITANLVAVSSFLLFMFLV